MSRVFFFFELFVVLGLGECGVFDFSYFYVLKLWSLFWDLVGLFWKGFCFEVG